MKTIGIIGGGQLGLMIIEQAHLLGARTVCLDPAADAPAFALSDERIVAAYDDPAALEELCRRSDAVTYEFENVPGSVLIPLEKRYNIPQGFRPLYDSQDRLREKDNARAGGLATPEYAAADDEASLRAAVAKIGLPAVLKTRTLGYDGHGQLVLKTEADIEKAAFLVDAVIEEDVELGLDERRSDLVLHHLDLDMAADHGAGGVFNGLLTADIEPHAGIELEGFASRRRLGVAEHDADLLANLVGEDAGGSGLGQEGGELAQRLAHQARLHPHGGHSHLAFEFRLGNQRGDRIDHDHVKGVGSGEGLADRERFLATVGLRHQQVVEIHPEPFGIAGIERMLGIDECRQTAHPLRVGHDMQHERRLA